MTKRTWCSEMVITVLIFFRRLKRRRAKGNIFSFLGYNI